MATQITLTSAALDALREYLKNNISYARYKVGSTYYTAELQDKSIMSDGQVNFAFLIDHTVQGEITISEIQLYSYNGVLWGSRAVSIKRAATSQGILYRCRFNIIQETD